MTIFEDQFKFFASSLSRMQITNYKDLIEFMKECFIPKKDDATKEAVILVGFSGNGKSTWIKNFINENKDFERLSWDEELIKYLVSEKKSYHDLQGEDQVRIFGEAMENLTDQGKNIVFDGNFLNLPLRMSIINTLHENGYNVSVVDITSLIDKTIKSRIRDEIEREKKRPENIGKSEEEIRKMVEERVDEHKRGEEQRSAFSYQQLYGAVSLGADRFYEVRDITTPFKIRQGNTY